MANTSRINGFRPVKLLGGSPYNGSFNTYSVDAGDGTAIYVGDAVKLAAAGADASGVKPSVVLAAAGDAIVGIVVGFGVNRDNLNIDGQRRLASTARDVYVADDPNLIFEVETSNGTPTAADVNLNINHAVGTPVAATARSGAYVDFGTEATTAALTFKIMGFVPREDNEVGASAKLLVKINNHQLGSHTGTAGV
jgi:hypothetical protein